MTTFRGRPIVAGHVRAEARVTHTGWNPLAAYREACVRRSRTARSGDPGCPELLGQRLDGRILCLPQAIGSTSGGLVLSTAASLGIGPAALLFSRRIDSLAASGVILSDVWLGQRIVTVDGLGDAFLAAVVPGSILEVLEDGTVLLP